jgi:RNA-binding protein
MIELSGRQKRHLRGLAHHLEPVVHLGKEGASDAVIAAVDAALEDHELVKVRMPQVDKAERTKLAEEIVLKTASALAGMLGRVAILYRRRKEKPAIELPR